MKAINLFTKILISLSLLLVPSCITTTSEVKQKPTAPTIQQAATYTGPKARISVGSIKCKAAKCSGAIGDGLRAMLISGLFKTNRFVVLGGREELEEIRSEIDLGQSGYVKQEQAPQAGGWESADIIILGAVTAFEPKAGGIGGGLGGLLPGFLGAIRLSKNDAYISMDLRIVDVRTRRIINTTTVDGKATSFSIGGLGAGWGGAGILGGALEVYKNTPMEKAIRVMIENAVNYIAAQTPSDYFRYPQSGTTIVSTPSDVQGQGGLDLEKESNDVNGGKRMSEKGVETEKDELYNEETIRFVQKQLKLAGYDPGPIDGIFGRRTKKAIRLFQKDNELEMTGNINKETLSLLKTINEHKKETMSNDIHKIRSDNIPETKKESQKLERPKTKLVRVVGSSEVDVKKNPDIFSEVITRVRPGIMLEMLGKSGEWYKVQTSKGIGYIFSDFIKEK